MLEGANPYLALRVVAGILPATGGASHDAIPPAPRRQVIQAVLGIGEILDSFLKSGWFVSNKPMLTGVKG
jgi:hypothetical protein